MVLLQSLSICTHTHCREVSTQLNRDPQRPRLAQHVYQTEEESSRDEQVEEGNKIENYRE